MLAMEYALTQPTGVASLVLSSGPASIPLWAEETNRLKNDLPDDVREVLDTAEIDSPEYEEASMEFYKRHVCRVGRSRTTCSAPSPGSPSTPTSTCTCRARTSS